VGQIAKLRGESDFLETQDSPFATRRRQYPHRHTTYQDYTPDAEILGLTSSNVGKCDGLNCHKSRVSLSCEETNLYNSRTVTLP
jgi:hypothetical protein